MLPKELVFEVIILQISLAYDVVLSSPSSIYCDSQLHYLGSTEYSFNLNFSRPAAPMIGQYFNFVSTITHRPVCEIPLSPCEGLAVSTVLVYVSAAYVIITVRRAIDLENRETEGCRSETFIARKKDNGLTSLPRSTSAMKDTEESH